MKKLLSLALVVAVAAGSQAALFNVLGFAPAATENFDTTPPGAYGWFPSMGGFAQTQMIGAGGALSVGNFGALLPSLTAPHSMFGRNCDVAWRFAAPIRFFGGYFRVPNVGAGVTRAQFRFYDAGGVLVGLTSAPVGVAAWQWRGWFSNIPFVRVEVLGNGPLPGYVGHDNVSIAP